MMRRQPHATLRRALLPIAIAVALGISACAGTRFGTGTPVVPKPLDGALLHGVEGPPDFQRGFQAMEEGRLLDAEHDFLQLANRGYPDAAMQLAASYAQRDSLDGETAAVDWYRRVLPRRPEADLGLARVLFGTGRRKDGQEALTLIKRAKRQRNPVGIDGLLLELYTALPELDRDGEARKLAEAASRSPLAVERILAVNWYAANIAVGDNAETLRSLCEANRRMAPNCYAELSRFHRYRGEADKLDGLIDEALASFEQLAAAPPDRVTPAQQNAALGRAASQLTMAMVDQLDVIDPNEVAEVFDATRAAAETARNNARAGADVELAGAAINGPQATPVGLRTPTRPDLADRVLRWMIQRGGDYPAYAANAVGRFEYLIADVDLAAMLAPLAERGSHEGILQLGIALNSNQRGYARTAEAERYLLEARKYRSTRQRAEYQLGRLYEQGFLGAPDPRKTVDFLVECSRSGDLRCPTRLARVFYGTPGFRVNRIGAYVFARISEDAGRPVLITERVLPADLASSSARAPTAAETANRRVVVKMLDRLRIELTEAEIAEAEAQYATERALQPLPPPPIPPDIYARKSAS